MGRGGQRERHSKGKQIETHLFSRTKGVERHWQETKGRLKEKRNRQRDKSDKEEWMESSHHI